jgi:hypothetical protein
MRYLREEERQLLLAFAGKLINQDKAQLIEDINNASVKSVADDGARILFDVNGYDRPTYGGQHSIPLEGRVLDADGTEMSVCVYADENDRLLELEFVRWGDGPILSPQWPTQKIY